MVQACLATAASLAGQVLDLEVLNADAVVARDQSAGRLVVEVCSLVGDSGFDPRRPPAGFVPRYLMQV